MKTGEQISQQRKRKSLAISVISPPAKDLKAALLASMCT